MIPRAILGAIERFMGILHEHCGGAFPLWLAPVQVKVLTLTERQEEYGSTVRDQMRARGLRVELDTRSEKLGYKIREAQLAKIPYMLVVGDKEMEARTVAPRSRTGGNAAAVALETFVEQLEDELRSHGHAAGVPRLEGDYAENQN
jgi:threonyl-tRNA synthetase